MLKEKVIEFIKKNPDSVNMGVFIKETPMSTCGTAACLAGHIVLASGVELEYYDGLGQRVPNLILSDVEFDEYNEWLEFEVENGSCRSLSKVPAYARYLWAKEYGVEAAESLPFYNDEWKNVVGYTKEQLEDVDDYGSSAFNKLTADDLIKFLESLQ